MTVGDTFQLKYRICWLSPANGPFLVSLGVLFERNYRPGVLLRRDARRIPDRGRTDERIGLDFRDPSIHIC